MRPPAAHSVSEPSLTLSSMPKYMRNSLVKPFSGGSAQMASVPTRNRMAVTGMLLATPPKRSSSVVCIFE